MALPKWLVVAAALPMLAACSSHKVALTYSPPPQLQPGGPPVVASVQAVDQRHESDPSWFGAIRGGYGNALKTLHTPGPLADAVQQAFTDALRDRGMLAPPGQGTVRVDVAVIGFEGDQLMRRDADIKLGVSVVTLADGRTIYTDTTATELKNGGILSMDTGIFGSVEALRTVVEKAMDQAIDQELSRPAFVAALRGQEPSASPTS